MKSGSSITVTTSLLVKTLIMSFILLTVAFIAGLVIGNTDRNISKNNSGSDSQLSACSFKLQEITAKHLSLMDIAKTKGFVSPDGKIDSNVICTHVKPVDDKDNEKVAVDENKVDEKTVEKNQDQPEECRFSIQLFSDTSRESAVAAQRRYKISGTYLVEAEVDEKVWYRIRYGCFSNRVAAEKELPEIREKVMDALVVGN